MQAIRQSHQVEIPRRYHVRLLGLANAERESVPYCLDANRNLRESGRP